MALHPCTHALIVVDLQNDFVSGALAVPGGREVLPVVNALGKAFSTVALTRDWHPPDHGSFAASHEGRELFETIDLNGLPQCLWPVHCVQGSEGAAFVPGLEVGGARIFDKGTDPAFDSYSGFYDSGRRQSTGLGEFLNGRGITDVFICGLATDYCVKGTALDAVELGFRTTLIEDAIRGVDVREGDAARAIEEMRRAGVRITDSATVLGASGAPGGGEE